MGIKRRDERGIKKITLGGAKLTGLCGRVEERAGGFDFQK